MPSFAQFASLPLELQREVWQAVLDEPPEPSVHVFRFEDAMSGDPASVTVDIEYNALMHVCHESRSMARKQLTFRCVNGGACFGPYRAFHLELDAIYVSARDWVAFFCAEFFASWTEPPANLRHLALDARVLGSSLGIRRFIECLSTLSGLQTVSVVFSEEGWVPRDHVPTGALQYQLVECAQGDSVWHAPRGRVKRQDMDPWEITKLFREDITNSFRQEIAGTGIPGWEDAPYDRNTGEFLFDIVPKRIVPKLEGRRHGFDNEASLLSSIIGGLRGLMPSYS
ncbi:hypothetical protein J7T55_001469 [Diaporthe amygdali]|uniref:uncharacterized protein n=1 Tax=Phomopsis amygdali TaxID=1214568 RepID=UPI0022FF45DD|nr:uncharacterized protein J7T55_001469 [Diaporthe amygdali]KAJ0115060.1 hypothetical protein J7T55_001469 [Diaporthe amygdali]